MHRYHVNEAGWISECESGSLMLHQDHLAAMAEFKLRLLEALEHDDMLDRVLAVIESLEVE